MRKTLLALAVLLPLLGAAPLRAEDPATSAFRQRLGGSVQEQILLAGMLTDPALSESFSEDAQEEPTEALLDKWRAQMALYAKDYVMKEHPVNLQAKTVRQMVSPAEWASLYAALDILSKSSSLTEQATAGYFAREIKAANEALTKSGDTAPARDAIAKGRPRLVDAYRQYLGLPATAKALSAWSKQKREEREDAQRSQELADKAKTAKEQAEKVRRKTDKAKKTASREKAASDASGGYDGGKGGAEDGAPVYAGKGGKGKPAKGGLSPSTPKDKKKTKAPLTVKPPPSHSAEDDDMAKLDRISQKVAGHKARDMAIVGAMVGIGAGIAVAGLLGAGIGGVVLAAAAYFIGRKFFG